MLDRLLDRGDDEPGVDHYELRYMPLSGGSWRRATHADLSEDVGDLSNKLDQSHIRQTAETENWKPGTYSLQGRRSDGTLTDFLWRFELEGEGDHLDAETEAIRRVERKLDRLENEESESVDPEAALEQMKFKVGIEALGNEQFMTRHGDRVAASVLGVGGRDGLDLDEVEEHGFAALAVDAYNNPEKIEIGSEKVGEALSAAFDGFESGSDGGSDGGDVDVDDFDADGFAPGENKDESGGVSRPEARYRLRFPNQYENGEVETAREILSEDEVAEIEEKRERQRERVETDDLEEPEIDAPTDDGADAAAVADGGESPEERGCEGSTKDDDPEMATDGGERDLLAGVEVRRAHPGAQDVFVGKLWGEFSDQELEWLSEKNPVGESLDERERITEVKSSGLDMLAQFGGVKFPDGREDRRVFLRRAAEAALRGDFYGPAPQPDGGRVARQPSLVRRASRNPVLTALLVAVVVLPLLGGGRGG
jgi:hypothetical protein